MYLEVKVGVLPSGDLVLIDVGVARFHGGSAVERRVQASGYLPIFTVIKHLLQGDACNAAEEINVHTFFEQESSELTWSRLKQSLLKVFRQQWSKSVVRM